MKKTYLQPQLEVILTYPERVLMASGSTTGDDEGVGGTVTDYDGEGGTPGGNFDPSTPGTGGADAPRWHGFNEDEDYMP